MKNKKLIANIILVILWWLGILLLNNILNIKHAIFDNIYNFNFLTPSIIISFIILLFYIFKVRKKNIYLDICFYLLLFFFNLFNGILTSSSVDTFFLLYVFIITFSFVIYKKISNFSFSLIIAFSSMILITLILGIFNLLVVVKYLLPICFIISLIYIYYKRKNYLKLTKSFFNKELLIFTILFVIALLGGIGRCVHVYDEYSHWAYDAKLTIENDAFGSSPDIMSKTRGYTPIITGWHYIVAQYSNFQEPNLYIGLSIFCFIYLMALFCNLYKKNNLLVFLSTIVAYSCAFYFGSVYSYGNLYADLAFACTFTSLFICYYYYRKKDGSGISNIPILFILPIVTLIKPSGCIVVFAFGIMVFLDYFMQGKINIANFFKKIWSFVKKYWKVLAVILGCYLAWNIYIKIINHFNSEFYDYTVMPWTLTSNMSYKLNLDFILSFFNSIFKSFDSNYIFSIINLSYFKFLIIIFTFLYFASYFYNNKDKSLTIKSFISLIISYVIFFGATMLSIFMMLSYYEASIFASAERYIDVMNVALVYLFIFFIISKDFIINKKREIISIIILLIFIGGLNFSQITYFITDVKSRMETQNIKYEHINKFKKVIKNTNKNDNIYIIDQKDTDGIMAMWYARYYLFPRNVNASSGAISWKIKTNKNKDDLKKWGMSAKDLEKCLIKYDFDYLYLYSVDKAFFKVTKNMYTDINEAKKYTLFKVVVDNNKVTLSPVV